MVRGRHYLLLILAWALLCLPNLGGASLWDIDEGNNATAGREMYDSGNWVVPTFNGSLREDKPALLYWLQGGAYHFFGVNEFSARLPSALAALIAVLVVYELARGMAGARVGLLAGVILSSVVAFTAAGHFANPDALLTACLTFSLAHFWLDYRAGRRTWMVLGGVSSGLAVLAKGPVGLVLPLAVVGLFLLWERRLGLLWDARLIGGGAVFVLVAGPWYGWVTAETKGQWLYGFWLKHNQNRFLGTMEGHSGVIVVYYLLVLIVGLAPWVVFLGSATWESWRRLRSPEAGPEPEPDEPRPLSPSAVRFLYCWVGVFLVFFSLARTKLPNYILPLYPALAVLISWWLQRWRAGRATLPRWAIHANLAGLVAVGVVVSAGLLIAGGVIPLTALRGRFFPGLGRVAFVGLVPILGALVAWHFTLRGRRGPALGALGVMGVVFTGTLAAFVPVALNDFKAARPLALSLPEDQTRREVRVATFNWFQPSIVFYCQRQVRQLDNEDEVENFLESPWESYLFLPAETWEALEPQMPVGTRLLARNYDLYRHNEIVVVASASTVRPPAGLASARQRPGR
jgi:4-amino-4-deoxy-L-arabinose transferase-like glycosyltransferase